MDINELLLNAKNECDEEKLERICTEEEQRINAMPEGMEKYRRYADLADTYIAYDMDNGALRLCDILTQRFLHPANDEERQHLDHAIDCLMALRRSDNDYIWEQSGKLLAPFI